MQNAGLDISRRNGTDSPLLEMLAQRFKVIAGRGDGLQGPLHAKPRNGRLLRPVDRAARAGAAVEQNWARQVLEQRGEILHHVVVGDVHAGHRLIADSRPCRFRPQTPVIRRDEVFAEQRVGSTDGAAIVTTGPVKVIDAGQVGVVGEDRALENQLRVLAGDAAHELLIQVCASLADSRVKQMEIRSLSEVMVELAVGTIVTWPTDETIPVGFGTIQVVPAWRFLLEMEPRT